jgi:transcriptional regulator with XRE-family HTH domain
MRKMNSLENSFNKYVGRKVRLRRQKLNLTCKELGERMGVSFQQISRYEKGVYAITSYRLVQLAKCLDTRTGNFLRGAPAVCVCE